MKNARYGDSLLFNSDDWRDNLSTSFPQKTDRINWVYARNFLLRFLGKRLDGIDPHEIEDITQEALIRLYRANERLSINNLEAIMIRIGRWCCVDYFRRRERWPLLMDPSNPVITKIEDPRPDPSEQIADPRERIEFVITEFFEQNNAACRKLATAYFERRSWNSVARGIGKTAAAVRKQWERCVQQLRKEFGERGPISGP
jgi:RNA polymerase sigma factor (sigma-70 family)